MSTADVSDQDSTLPFSPVVGAVITQMFKDSAAVTNSLVGNLTYQNAQYTAIIDLIREDITALFDGPYMPNSIAVLSALYPAGDRVTARMRENDN